MADVKPWSSLRARLYSFVNRNPDSNDLVVRLAGLDAADKALDIGCGPGAAVRRASEVTAEAVGVDRSGDMVEIARKRSSGRPNVRFEVGAVESLPFADDEFSSAWTVHAFHHWEDQEAGLAECRRVLAPGGRLLIVEKDVKRSKGHGLTSEEIEGVTAKLQRAGFAEVVVSKHDKQFVLIAH